jgi:hypothetical protein
MDRHQLLRQPVDAGAVVGPHGPNHEGLAVRGYFEGRVFVNGQQVENRALNDQAEAIPNGGELFDHTLLKSKCYNECMTKV